MHSVSGAAPPPRRDRKEKKVWGLYRQTEVTASYCPALAHGAGIFSHPNGQKKKKPVSREL